MYNRTSFTFFAENHKLSFNPTKSTVWFFTTNRKLYGYQPGIVMNHQPLTVEKHPKYLGFVLDPEITPILEYGILVYCCASNTNLQKLERVQLSAARVITGLRNTCSNDIVLYEADLQPLSLRRSASLVKYYGKLCSLGDRNRTSAYLRDLRETAHSAWWASAHLLESNMGQHILVQCVDPSDEESSNLDLNASDNSTYAKIDFNFP
ncbi:putative RNA-directed DNA polymerase from transposon BS [Caerostris extrusa]|uniref:RNA-directed DNA polymerase from transposon BS n=1 Tax=Caerostris extrusa TaxID=172846 RepID=A0AAV4W479_CAEEX|nr:putative RNA-directed DNA polymerase from transposon BS [Caerostris extrusa]